MNIQYPSVLFAFYFHGNVSKIVLQRSDSLHSNLTNKNKFSIFRFFAHFFHILISKCEETRLKSRLVIYG